MTDYKEEEPKINFTFNDSDSRFWYYNSVDEMNEEYEWIMSQLILRCPNYAPQSRQSF